MGFFDKINNNTTVVLWYRSLREETLKKTVSYKICYIQYLQYTV